MIRYYPNVLIQNKHIRKMQKKLGYTPSSAKKADHKVLNSVKGKNGMANLMQEFKKDAPNFKKMHARPTTDSSSQSLEAQAGLTKSSAQGKLSSASSASSKANSKSSKSSAKSKSDFSTKTMSYKDSESHNPINPKSPYGNKLMFGPGWTCPTLGGSQELMDMPIKYALIQRHRVYTQHKLWTGSKGKQLYLKAAQSIAKDPQSKNAAKYSKDISNYLKANSDKNKKAYKKRMSFWTGMFQKGLGYGDMTPFIYKMRATNPNTISFWYPPLMKAYDQSNHFFKVPKTKIWTLPIEIAQYLQTDYTMTNQKSRDMLNKLCVNAFDLDPNESYFIKTGVFSGKYEFKNAHCKEPDQMGEYFHVISNFAMSVGANTSIDLCAREWIPDPEHRPTIYDGMPLRTEFRSFVDLTHKKVIGIVPYWNPIVMDRVLQKQGQHNPAILRDYHVYRQNIPFMMKEFNQAVPTLKEQIGKLIQHTNEPLHGKWSLDIMKSGKNYYLIDMALMSNSALTELLPKYHF